jgi:hypothetical protein
MSYARSAIQVALSASICAALSRLLNTPILDIEGCFRGPRESTTEQFVARLRLHSPRSDLMAAAKQFAVNLGMSGEDD